MNPNDVLSKVQIEYRYRYQGQDYTGLYSSALSSEEFFKRRLVKRYSSGGPASIRVDPGNPAHSRLKTNFFRENELGLVFSAIGIFFLILFARMKDKPLPPNFPTSRELNR